MLNNAGPLLLYLKEMEAKAAQEGGQGALKELAEQGKGAIGGLFGFADAALPTLLVVALAVAAIAFFLKRLATRRVTFDPTKR